GSGIFRRHRKVSGFYHACLDGSDADNEEEGEGETEGTCGLGESDAPVDTDSLAVSVIDRDGTECEGEGETDPEEGTNEEREDVVAIGESAPDAGAGVEGEEGAETQVVSLMVLEAEDSEGEGDVEIVLFDSD
ncbi:hypothetical protein KIPB_009444, partial [Kipferlia bialata]